MNLQSISNLIEVVPDFPEAGIFFRDISQLLAHFDARDATFDMLYDLVKDLNIDYVVGIESRGFIFGVALAERLKCGFVMLRKPGRHPNPIKVEYGLEYKKQETLCIQPGIIHPGKNVLIVDDILATGGSFLAACELVADKAGANIAGLVCLAELFGLPKRERQIKNSSTGLVEKTYKLNDFKIFSLLKYSANESSKFISRHDQLFNAKKVDYFPLEYPFCNDRRVIVFSTPSMRSIANGIVSKSMNFRSGAIHWNYFPDGFPNIKFEHMKFLENRDVVFIGSLFDKATLLEQLSMTLVLSDQFVRSLSIVFPYFAPGTMERVEEEGTLATAETTSRLITSALPLTKTGRPTLHIFDIHALPNRFYFPKDKVCVRMETGIDLLLKKIPKTITIVFPDDGAYKRFRSIFEREGFKIVICSKIRIGDDRIIKIVDMHNISKEDVSYLNDMIIVDDLVQSGKTLEECRKALVNLGAKRVSCYVTHAVFPKKGYKKFINSEFYKFYITNTIPENANVLENVNPFEVLHIEELLINRFNESFELVEKENDVTHLTCYVASTNKTKLEATYVAIKEYLKTMGTYDSTKVHITGVAVPSEVAEQPIGSETYTGCANRLANLTEYVKYHKYNYNMLVSIENGVSCLEDDTDPYDFAVVKIQTVAGEEVMITSDHKTVFPKTYLERSVAQNQSVTVGNLIEKDLNIRDGLWHTRFGTKSRQDDLKDTIITALNDDSLCSI
jgi:adenine phosphoribosyltransferase